MRVLVVHPGHDTSTTDVYRGLTEGLESIGVDVIRYDLGVRWQMAGIALHELWREGGKPDEIPEFGQVMFEAGRALYADVLMYQPDVTLVVTGTMLHPDHLVLLRRGGCPCAIVDTESPYLTDQLAERFSLADIVWTNERSAVGEIQRLVKERGANTQVSYLPTAYDPASHVPGSARRSHDVVFVGTGFMERMRMLLDADWSGIDLGLYGNWWQLPGPWPLVKRQDKTWARWSLGAMSKIGQASPLWKHVAGSNVSNALVRDLYRGAHVNLNFFRSSKLFSPDTEHIPYGESMGPRCSELAAQECFFISEYRSEVEEKFGDLVPTFRNGRELEHEVRRWLSDEKGREAKASALPGVVTSDTYRERAKRIASDLKKII